MRGSYEIGHTPALKTPMNYTDRTGGHQKLNSEIYEKQVHNFKLINNEPPK